ncbi:hypothetical protein [Demequina globuliformis]|uniref:hypothetical protein n=1 Tax=Demequina globuliformis TaxID=676202 RepID=UPI000A859A96|nr:hypothetical protein [Demequina globuliformis]
MQVGATLGRRFTLAQAVEHDLPGTERWIADDTRLAQRVTIDIIRGDGATAVRQAAVKAAQVRDARFARIISTGRHTDSEGTVTYIVSERPRGVSGEQVLARFGEEPDVVGALVGEAARALESMRAFGLTHGYIRPQALLVSPAGRVIVLGLGVDGVLAQQAGLTDDLSEKADAAALSRMYLEAVTGRPAADATAPDVPDSLGTGATALTHATIAGDPPTALGTIASALGPARVQRLRKAAATAASPLSPRSPATPGSAQSSPSARSAPEEDGDATTGPEVAQPEPHDIAIAPHTLHEAAAAAEQSQSHPAVVPTPRAVPRDEPLPPPDPKLEPLRAWDGIVDAQNARPKPSFVEAVLGGVRKLAPGNEALESAHVRAHARAHRTAPLNVGPLVLALTLLAVVIIVVIAMRELAAPIDPDFDLYNNPPPSYPSYTYSPPSYPSASPSASPSGE